MLLCYYVIILYSISIVVLFPKQRNVEGSSIRLIRNEYCNPRSPGPWTARPAPVPRTVPFCFCTRFFAPDLILPSIKNSARPGPHFT